MMLMFRKRYLILYLTHLTIRNEIPMHDTFCWDIIDAIPRHWCLQIYFISHSAIRYQYITDTRDTHWRRHFKLSRNQHRTFTGHKQWRGHFTESWNQCRTVRIDNHWRRHFTPFLNQLGASTREKNIEEGISYKLKINTELL